MLGSLRRSRHYLQAWLQAYELPLMLTLLGLGSLLRLVWTTDMEWKQDEIWMYTTAQQVVSGAQPWPLMGMPSSVGLLNPGLSVWCFIAIAYVAHNPIEMVRWVQGINILVLWMLLGFFYWQLAASPRERSTWLWGVTLMGVSPIAILFSRKLWTIDILPLFLAVLMVAHWFRQRRWGSCLWGLGGAAIGQVHMSGFFLATALFFWTLFCDWRQRCLGRTRWLSWGLGTAIGLIPLVPWLIYAAAEETHSSRSWVGVIVPKFFIHWLTTSLGINLSYSLGDHFWSDFLQAPAIAGVPTYAMAILHGGLTLVGLWGLTRWVRSFQRPFQAMGLHHTSPLGFYLRAAGLWTGLIFTLFGLNIPVHYVAIAFPFLYLWQASIWADKTLILPLMALSQLLISIGFLWFIHTTGGFVDADYGLVYRLQGYLPPD